MRKEQRKPRKRRTRKLLPDKDEVPSIDDADVEDMAVGGAPKK